MKVSLLKQSAFLLLLLMALTWPLQAQQTKNNAFIEQGTFLTGLSFSFIKNGYATSTDDFNNTRNYTRIEVVSIQIDALYFITDHIGAGVLLGYQSLYRTKHDNNYEKYDKWGLKYGFQAAGYLPVQIIFGGRSRSQLFLNGGISWLNENNTFNGSYNLGYKVGLGTLLPVAKRVGVKLGLNYLARSENKTYAIQCGVIPPCPPPRHDTVWHRNIILNIGLNVAF